MRLLLFGSSGQVGGHLLPLLHRSFEVTPLERSRVDLAVPQQIRDAIRTVRPDVIVNAAAYTQVDRAESQPDVAHAVNAVAPAVMADEAKLLGGALIHYSTDYVFDGSKRSPYTENDAPCPLNVYGRTKAAGDAAILASGARAWILRTSWVYSETGRNFLRAILDRARKNEPLRVVNDQIGAPTWSKTIAEVTAEVLRRTHDADPGLYNLSSQGHATWFEFAREILSASGVGRLEHIVPITTADYKAPAPRSLYSVLDTAKIKNALRVPLPHWRDALRLVLGAPQLRGVLDGTRSS